jgi:chemosensory pili system protein ChpA (sensor histidine kinase/response regulator)
VAVDIPLDLDSGPIVWVKAELDNTLLAALDGITRIQAGETGTLSATVRSNLHRAGGAFELVGVEGLAVLLRELESHFPDPPEVPRAEALQTVAGACRRLIAHLEEIAVGAQPVPLRFLPEYLALGRLRDIRFGPADLFFPDLSRKPRFMDVAEPIEPSKMPSYLLRHRRDFQRGFLDWLRGVATDNGIAIMQRALLGIEEAHPLPSQRSFWWATGALLEAVQNKQVDSSTSIKQLFARIDLQIRRLVEGSTKVADRLKREVLYHVARVGDGSPRCDEVKALYSLDVLVPKRVARELDIVALRPSIERLIELVTRCKEEWGAVSTSRSGAADRLANALAELPRACDAIGLRSLSELGTGLAHVAPLIATRSLSDEASLEFASCLLLLETSTQHLAALPKSFPAEVSTALKRLGYATSRAPIPDELVDDMGSGSLTRLAQERETVAQVCREIRANMRQVEAGLDAVFRDNTAVEDLAAIPGLLAQVSGALRLLGWNEAHGVVAQVSDRVATLVQNPSDLQPAEIDRIANVLAGFGFYVDARERKESGAEAILDSLHRTLLGEDVVAVSAATEHSVEMALGARIRSLKTDFTHLRGNAGDERARAAVVSGLNDVRRDAELLDDAALARAAKSGLNLLTAGSLDIEALQAELKPMLGTTQAPAPVSAETQRILDASPASQDTALLEIFIEEAEEVVGNVAAAMSEYQQAPSRRDLLTDIRRGFHTLKGSGRMVGLQALGDAAWSVERVLNPALEDNRSLSANETELVNSATARFKVWVSELQSSGRSSATSSAFDELVAKCGLSVAPPAPPPIAPKASVASPIAAPMLDEVDSPSAAVAPLALSVDAITSDVVVSKKDDVLLEFIGQPTEKPIFELPALEPFAHEQPASASAPAVASSPTEINFDSFLESETAPAMQVETTKLAWQPADALVPIVAPAMVSAPTTPSAFAPPAWSDELELDGVRVSRTLFSIMGDEARSHLVTLDQEMSLMQFDPSLLPSDTMVRASHTLCGIHRTAGFGQIGNLAGLLEDALVSIRRSKRVDESLLLISDSVETLRTSVLRLQAQLPMSDAERHMIESASSRLESFVAAAGGQRGGAAAEIARASAVDDEPAFEIEEEITFDLPEDFGATSAFVAPALVPASNASAAAPVAALEAVAEFTPAADTALVPDAASTGQLPTTPSLEPSSVVPVWGAAAAAAMGAAAFTAVAANAQTAAPTATMFAPQTPDSDANIAAPAVADIPDIVPDQLFEAPPEVIGEKTASAQVSVPIDMRVNAPFVAVPVASAVAAAPEDPLLGINDDIDVQVLPIFLEEAQELFPAASAQIRTLRASPNDRDNIDSLKRTLHTLKGSARMAGAMRLGELTHIVESAVDEKADNRGSAEFDRIEERFDDVAFVLDALVAGKYDVVLPRFVEAAPAEQSEQPLSAFDASAESAAALIAEQVETGKLPSDADIAASLPDAIAAAARDAASVAPADTVAATVAAPRAATAQPTTTVASPVQPEGAVAFLRVRTDAVELLADEAGEIAINRSRIESELRGLKSSLTDLTSFVVRLRTLLREIEIQGESQIQSRLDQESTFDPLEFDRYTRFQELTRSLAEGVNDVGTVQQSLLRNIDDAETALAAQTRLSRSVQLRLQSLRTVPFSTVSERLYRVLRQTAKDVGKRANLEIEGGRIEIDRGVLERLIPVLEHLVRNSFAHGIEAPEARETAGKAQIGEINIAVKQQGNEVAIVVSDDGAGIALERVRQRAVSAGLARADDALNDAQLIEFIFRPGFTTADTVTAIAGRGVGMDVVRSELAALGGRVVAATSAGVGTTFTLSVPLTLAVTQVLLVNIAGTVYAIPSSLIETVRQVPARDRAVALAAKQFDHAGKFVPYRSMSVLLGGRPNATVHKSYSVAFLKAGDTTAAIEVDHVIGNQEVVAKPYGPQLARLPGMAGLTVLGDGKIVLLMDPLALLRASAEATSRAAMAQPAAVTPVAGATIVTPVAGATTVTPVAEATIAAPPPSPSVASSVSESIPAPSESITAAATPTADDPPSHAVEPEPTPMSTPLASTPAPVLVTVAPTPPPEPEPEVLGRLPIVLVVDDSLTVRKITSRLLEREGYKALTAKDGLDALQVLSDVNPDVILLDIEMPRMDGFEFTKTIKSDNRQNNIPIIMITSRTAEKHRNHAQELGVNEYLGKPYQDDELMSLIGKYTAHVVRPT